MPLTELPQHWTFPAVVTAQLCDPPTPTCVNVPVVGASVTWPLSCTPDPVDGFSGTPQHTNSPVVRTAHVCPYPHDTSWNVPVGTLETNPRAVQPQHVSLPSVSMAQL